MLLFLGHYSNSMLEDRGLTEIKGSPQSFDLEEFVQTVQAVKRGINLLAPSYSREVHEPVHGVLEFGPETKIAIAEGNYLLLNDRLWWPSIAKLADVTVSLRANKDLLIARLLNRHMRGGKTREAALQKIANSDIPNIDLVTSKGVAAHLEFYTD